MSTAATLYTRTLGARLLSEANDLKRTAESLADEMDVPFARIKSAIDGELNPSEYRDLFAQVAQRYPISFGRLWIEPTDTVAGVRHMTARESAASSRIFDRRDRSGAITPYYEYRDTAMSRLAPFRPEWIRELRVIDSADPNHPDVAYNHGHFLHQTTFFIGPVNFYWEVDGRRYSAELNTGDSNYITPFWPHSFASRDATREAVILAVTYGGEVARAREELARIGGDTIARVAVDVRNESLAFRDLLARHCAQESLPTGELVARSERLGMKDDRVRAFLDGAVSPSAADIAILARALHVHPRDLMAPVRCAEDEVIVLRHSDTRTYPYPDVSAPCYEVTPLVRSLQQPNLKTFILKVLPDKRGESLQFPLHQYIYNYGDSVVRLRAQSGRESQEFLLAPGDSAYVMPMVEHAFDAASAGGGTLYVVRVPGDLHADAIFELSGMAPVGLTRAAAETTRWF